MNLGQLRKTLDVLIAEHGEHHRVPFGFDDVHSWRGIYAEVAFEPSGPTTLGAMRALVERALTEEFEGYKGGEYTYNEYTTAHLDGYGRYHEDASGRLMMLMASLIVVA